MERLTNTGWTLLRQGYGGQADCALANTGWTDEARAASLAVRQAKAKERRAARDRMFAEQERRGGSSFIENWYPRGEDGKTADPHYGETSSDAPYGYVDETDTPRKEPLYDRDGVPIIPRPWKEFHEPEKSGVWPLEQDMGWKADRTWLRKAEAAEKLWGRFGRKKRFFDRNPDASEHDWEHYERDQYEKWKKENGEG